MFFSFFFIDANARPSLVNFLEMWDVVECCPGGRIVSEEEYEQGKSYSGALYRILTNFLILVYNAGADGGCVCGRDGPSSGRRTKRRSIRQRRGAITHTSNDTSRRSSGHHRPCR